MSTVIIDMGIITGSNEPRTISIVLSVCKFDYMFWSIPNNLEFPWIVWYIWKARNYKIFKNLDRDLIGLLQVAKAEATLWESTQCVD